MLNKPITIGHVLIGAVVLISAYYIYSNHYKKIDDSKPSNLITPIQPNK